MKNVLLEWNNGTKFSASYPKLFGLDFVKMIRLVSSILICTARNLLLLKTKKKIEKGETYFQPISKNTVPAESNTLMIPKTSSSTLCKTEFTTMIHHLNMVLTVRRLLVLLQR